MKKGKYIDIYVMMACLSQKKSKQRLRNVNRLLNKACSNCNEKDCVNKHNQIEMVFAEPTTV